MKTRRNLKYGRPIDAVNNAKIKHIKKSAMFYVLKTKKENSNVRFDVIEIYLVSKKIIIKHYKQII